MFKNEASKKQKVILVTLLIIINIVLRIVSITHETGNDSYQIHALANSISDIGNARWWVNSLSAFGLYSYSYASAVPFSLSGMSQLLNMDMEKTILLYCMILGLLSIGTAYLMAGVLYDNFLFKYIFSFFFSTSQGILQFTLFDASTRGMFMVMFPLFFYILLKKDYLWRNIICMILLFIFLRSVHNFSYFTLPLIFTMALIYTVSRMQINPRYKEWKLFKKTNFTYIYIVLIICSFLYPFFAKLFVVGSRYEYLINMVIIIIRYVGPLVILTLGGVIYSIFKKEKTFADWFILISVLFFIPMMYSEIYGAFIIIPFVIFFVAVGFKNIIFAFNNARLRSLIIISLIISSVIFSSFFNHYRIGSSEDHYWYMSEEVNGAGIWARQYIPENSHVYTTVGEVWRMLAVSEGHIEFPSLSPLSLTYGFVNKSEVINNSIENSYTSLDYYFDGPFVQKSGTDILGEYDWIKDYDVKDGRVEYFMKRYNIKYIVCDVRAGATIVNSADENNDLIFDNNLIRIWTVY